uniref:Uncharacterized protein n=1 Tax=Arundo donax TaxID=35708 RepID=A0A0A8YJA4_ARUDO
MAAPRRRRRPRSQRKKPSFSGSLSRPRVFRARTSDPLRFAESSGSRHHHLHGTSRAR